MGAAIAESSDPDPAAVFAGNHFLMLKYDDPELCGENDKKISSISKIAYSLLYVVILPLFL